ncbi:GntR family transcriptional regulator [Streptomyces violascens]|uniref:GntR family transcriptional regulator n=1 Tax=Streptomyces violascens TaxID=67381 RepID=UPI00364C1743
MDWTSEKPLTAKEIAARFRDAIADGEYAPGQQLPGAKGLARELGVALQTMQNAYKELAADGLVAGRVGSGTYVLDPRKGDPSPQETATGLRDLQKHLNQLTSQLSDLRDRVERLEADHPGHAVENK